MHYLLTPEEFETLRGFTHAKKWEHDIHNWYRGLVEAILKADANVNYASLHSSPKVERGKAKERYENEHPYPKLEDYLTKDAGHIE
jgi:hypothetical protein